MPITLITETSTSIPSLSWSDSGLLSHRPSFNPMPVHEGFAADNVTYGHVVLQVLQVIPVSIIQHYFILNNPSIDLSYQLTVSLKNGFVL